VLNSGASLLLWNVYRFSISSPASCRATELLQNASFGNPNSAPGYRLTLLKNDL
jgi:hypothetical protein